MAVEPSADIIDQAACAEIRKILTFHEVPVAAFIDDHVLNAIRQRDQAQKALLDMREIALACCRASDVDTINQIAKGAFEKGMDG